MPPPHDPLPPSDAPPGGASEESSAEESEEPANAAEGREYSASQMQCEATQLMTAARSGSAEAFETLFQRVRGNAFQAARSLVGSREDALDLTQEAFIKAYRALPRFRGDSAFYTWLYRIAVNTAKNHLAAQRRRPMDIELDLQDPEQYELHARLRETDTPEGVSMSRELQETIEKAIQGLPDDLRTAIILRELDGMSYEEIAETMECPVGTVRSRIFRARDAISKKLGSLIR